MNINSWDFCPLAVAWSSGQMSQILFANLYTDLYFVCYLENNNKNGKRSFRQFFYASMTYFDLEDLPCTIYILFVIPTL